MTRWVVAGKSVIGASHARIDRPNQDAIWPQECRNGAAVLCVSDGHGSKRYFRSDEGAKIAVQTASIVLSKWADPKDPEAGYANWKSLKDTAEDRLPKAIVSAWMTAVLHHQSTNPFLDSELLSLTDSERGEIDRRPEVAYGATLLCVLVTRSFVLYLQLGDGDIVSLDAQFCPSRPIPEDSSLFANETTSLCQRNAWEHFRVATAPVSDSSPVLIVLSTDGVVNSYSDDAAFLQLGQDLLAQIAQRGIDSVNAGLEDILVEISKRGSGDDVTLGLLFQVDAMTGADTIKDTAVRVMALERDRRDEMSRIDDAEAEIKSLSEKCVSLSRDDVLVKTGILSLQDGLRALNLRLSADPSHSVRRIDQRFLIAASLIIGLVGLGFAARNSIVLSKLQAQMPITPAATLTQNAPSRQRRDSVQRPEPRVSSTLAPGLVAPIGSPNAVNQSPIDGPVSSGSGPTTTVVEVLTETPRSNETSDH